MKRKPWLIVLVCLAVAGSGCYGYYYWKTRSPAIRRFAIRFDPGSITSDLQGRRSATASLRDEEVEVTFRDTDIDRETGNKFGSLSSSFFSAFGSTSVAISFKVHASPGWFIFFDEQGNLVMSAPDQAGLIYGRLNGSGCLRNLSPEEAAAAAERAALVH